ncbi:MAG: efflux RND transporter periplasmic adaptor subunit [Nannocystales bacterium]
MRLRCWTIVLLVSCACTPDAPAKERDTTAPTTPATATLREAPDAHDAAMLGVLVPASDVVLVARRFARLQQIDVQVGDAVARGDVVAQMDVRQDESEMVSAKAAWRSSSAEFERFALELEQARAIREDSEQLEGLVPGAELRVQRLEEKLARARIRSAGASVSERRNNMNEASARLEEAELRAPFAGRIAKRYVDAGSTLDAGEPVVQLISSDWCVRFAVPEARVGTLRLAAPVTVLFERPASSTTVELRGSVRSIAPEIDPGTRLVIAEATLTPSAQQRESLRIGAVGQVRLEAPP